MSRKRSGRKATTKAATATKTRKNVGKRAKYQKRCPTCGLKFQKKRGLNIHAGRKH